MTRGLGEGRACLGNRYNTNMTYESFDSYQTQQHCNGLKGTTFSGYCVSTKVAGVSQNVRKEMTCQTFEVSVAELPILIATD
jgi:hypothetical protein